MSFHTNSTKPLDPQQNLHLHEYFSNQDIEDLHAHFLNFNNQLTDRYGLRELLGRYSLFYTKEQFENFFLRIDINRDGLVGWHEFVSFLILGLRDNDPANQKDLLSLPIMEKPIVLNAHRNKIIRVARSDIGYTTIDMDGVVKYWSLRWELLRTEKSAPKEFRCTKTLVVDAIDLSSLGMLCISSVKCDLRFIDTEVKFVHRFNIEQFPLIINVMHFHSSTGNSKGKLILGDIGGNVWVLEIPASIKNCFNTDNSIVEIKFSAILKENRYKIKCREFRNMHLDMVRQVGFIESLNAFVSAADYQFTKNIDDNPAAVVIGYLGQQKFTSFVMNEGATCFVFDERTKTLVTGGLDCNLRLWNPMLPKSSKSILAGHAYAIKHIFLQDNFLKIYSIDRMKIIMIWDTEGENVIQTYNGLTSILNDDLPSFSIYNDATRELILGTKNIVILQCCPLLDLESTDGYTHTRSVSVVLYNELFQLIVTCGFDSLVIVWHPWTGKRSTLIRMAHTRIQHGQILRVEITAACFDIKGQLLLTGARDGSLKIWNFNNGNCIRNFSIKSMCEVTAVFWVHERIFAVGWDKVITEFSDKQSEIGEFVKWNLCHADEIICAAKNPSEAIATCSSSGELVFWDSFTGQPYLRFNVKHPRNCLKILYKKTNIILDASEMDSISSSETIDHSTSEASKLDNRLSFSKQSISRNTRSSSLYRNNKLTVPAFARNRATVEQARKLCPIVLPEKLKEMAQLSVQAMLFLDTRPMVRNIGSLLVALSDGNIQIWSHHPETTSVKGSFNAIHMAGDQVTAMATDKNNFYLFTGSTYGYVKIWLIADYCLPNEHAAKVSKVEQRTKFPFLWKDTIEGRAKRSVLKQNKPWLVNSFNAHKNTITKIAFIEGSEVLVTASADYSVRLWTIQGQYIGTLGSSVKWESITPNKAIPPDFAHRLPPDIKRDISFTTLKVLTGGRNESVLTSKLSEKRLLDKMLVKQVLNETGEPSCDRPYVRLLQKPLMTKHLPLQERSIDKPVLDTSLPIIPVYSHLKIYPTVKISAPRRGVSECLQKLEELECIFTKP